MAEDHTFCRLHLKEVMTDVRQVATSAQIDAAWAWKTSLGGEFHGPGNLYWHGQVHCLWEAKARGWTAWLEQEADRCQEQRSADRVDGYDRDDQGETVLGPASRSLGRTRWRLLRDRTLRRPEVGKR